MKTFFVLAAIFIIAATPVISFLVWRGDLEFPVNGFSILMVIISFLVQGGLAFKGLASFFGRTE